MDVTSNNLGYWAQRKLWISQQWKKGALALVLGGLFSVVTINTISEYGSIRFAWQAENSCLPGAKAFWVSKQKPSELEKGDLIAFHPKGLPGYSENDTFVKYVRGVPGDKVEIKPEEGVFVNDVFLTSSFYHEASIEGGKAALKAKGHLDKNKYWVMGTGETSYDSRYYGAIDESQIMGKAYILWPLGMN